MADKNDPTEWYLARDGQQHGPVSAVELEKIIELGYLRPTDLVWRQGMAEWVLAETVLDMSGQKQAAPPAPPAPAVPVTKAPEPEAIRAAAPRRSAAESGSGEPRGQVHQESAPAPAPHGGLASARSTAPAPSRPSPQQPSRQPAETALDASRPGPSASQWEPHPASRARTPGDPGPSSSRPARADPALYPSGPSYPAPGDRPRPVPAPLGEEIDEDEPRRGFPWRTAIVLLLVGGLGAGAYALHRTGQLSALPFLGAPQPSSAVPVVNRPSAANRETTPAPTTAPAASAAAPAGSFEQSLQRAPLWQRLKRDFPDWHKELSAEIGRLAADSRSERELQGVATRALIELRKRHHAEALASSPPRLRAIAQAFVANLAALSRESIPACYGFISQGEASPATGDLQSPAAREAIDAQLGAIFDAVVEGRQSPVKHEQPRREDYDALTQQLGRKGWTPPDLQLFMDARALSRAAPEKVCQMVQDWFAAQLAIEDEATRTRLLSESLKPVVAG